MADKSRLSHHEQLRYDYLYKNYHYLNDREKQELVYLQQKMEGAVDPSPREEQASPRRNNDPVQLPRYETKSRKQRKAEKQAAAASQPNPTKKTSRKKVTVKRQCH